MISERSEKWTFGKYSFSANREMIIILNVGKETLVEMNKWSSL